MVISKQRLSTFLGVAWLWLGALSASAQTGTTDKREVRPELTYRMATLAVDSKSAYHNSTHRDFLDQLYLTLKYIRTYDYQHRMVIEPVLRTKRENPDKIDTENVIDQAYIESELGAGFGFTAGKKVEYHGSGFFVNPSDLLNEDKDLYDSLYQRTGKVFTRLNWGMDGFNVGVGFVPSRAQDANRGKAWLLMTGNVWNTDLVLQQTHSKADKATTGFSAARFFGDHLGLHVDARHQMNQRAHTEFAERQYAVSYGANPDDPTLSDNTFDSVYYLVGTRLVLTPRRTFIAEYFTNQSGLLPDELKLYLDFIRTSPADELPPIRPLMRHYAFASYQDEDTLKNFQLGLSFLANLDDDSQFISAHARYIISPVTSLEIAPMAFVGEPNSEYGEMPFRVVNYITIRGRF